MNKKYQSPKMEALLFEVSDIVTASTPVNSGWDDTNGEMNGQYPEGWDQFGIN